MPELPLTPPSSSRSIVSLRAVALGLLGTGLICALTPYNDYALNNTFLVGNNLPLGAVVLAFLFTVAINGPISRWAPRHALSSGEVTVAFSMMLVSCALPSTGLMRYLPAALTAPFYYSSQDAEFRALFESMHLPAWLFPKMHGGTIRQWMNDPIVTGFHTRWTESGSIPYAAWIRPAIAWGVFVFAMYGALLCLLTMVRRQWFENERLPFPLAQIQLALVEQPATGRAFNSVMRRRSFWIAFAAVFLLHAYNGLANYFPKEVARIPIGYNIHDLFTEPPWSYFDSKIKDNFIFFAVVGVTFFVPGTISFSLWFFYVLMNLVMVGKGIAMGDPIIHGRFDQHFGGVWAYLLIVLWTGRRHWAMVIRQALRGRRDEEPDDPYLRYRTAAWGLIGCAAIMTGWLWSAGCTIGGAATLTFLLLMLMMMITRIIAETGLVHGQLQFSLGKPWGTLVWAGMPRPVPLETYYLGAVLNSVVYDYREVMPVYASHGMKLADETAAPVTRSTGRRFIAALLLALVVGYVTSFTSMLWTEYTFDATRDAIARSPINEWGARDNPRNQVMSPTVYYSHGKFEPMHDPPTHMATGFLVTMALGALRWLVAWWPLHPLGYLLWLTFPVAHLWFSIMLGWLVRALVLRFGGASLYTAAKPLFIGLIVGESMAAGGWLIVGIVLSALGVPYRPVQIMPG